MPVNGSSSSAESFMAQYGTDTVLRSLKAKDLKKSFDASVRRFGDYLEAPHADRRIVQTLTPRRALGSYEGIAGSIPCVLCPRDTCIHGALPNTTNHTSAAHSDNYAYNPDWFNAFRTEVMGKWSDDAREALPEKGKRAAPSPFKPVENTEALKRALKQYERDYADAWQRILGQDSDVNPFVVMEQVLKTARQRLITPTAWWPGRELAIGPDGVTDTADPKARRWSIAGSLFSGDENDAIRSEGIRRSLCVVAAVATTQVYSSWVDADQVLTHWNSNPDRLYEDVSIVLRDAHVALRERI